MLYSTPELVTLGSATALVQGEQGGINDNLNGEVLEKTPVGLAVGLDD